MQRQQTFKRVNRTLMKSWKNPYRFVKKSSTKKKKLSKLLFRKDPESSLIRGLMKMSLLPAPQDMMKSLFLVERVFVQQGQFELTKQAKQLFEAARIHREARSRQSD